MSKNPTKIHNEKLRIQEDEFKNNNSSDTFLGIPLNSSSDANEDEVNSTGINFSFNNQQNSENNQPLQFSYNNSQQDSFNPSVRSMINQLESCIKSGKIDQQAFDIFQQLSQLIPTNLISNYSSIIDNSSIEKIKQLSNTSTINQQSDPKLIDQNQNSESTELTNQEKQYLSDFYGNIRENSNQAVKSLENDIQDNFKDITKNHSNLNQTN
jgi:hypothetical protein